MVSVGIVGGSGYMGGEALRVLLRHPHADIAWVTSRSPGPVEQVHPNLYDTGLHFVRLEDVKTPDFVLLALPTGASIEVAVRFLQAGARVIDLGAAFRLHERHTWERVYGQPHAAWPLVHEAVYGMPELHAERIRTARLVANPGCFSSAAILGLAPLLKAGLVDGAAPRGGWPVRHRRRRRGVLAGDSPSRDRRQRGALQRRGAPAHV